MIAEDYALDLDPTVKPLDGHQEGAEFGYSPQKPGRPSHCYHLLMQIAHNLWQVFESGIVRNLSKGVSRPTQSLWAKKLCEALHNIDFSDYEPETVYLSREYELECLTE